MRHRHPLLPSMPMLGLGTAAEPEQEAMAAAVQTALVNGVTLIDTAQNYGSEKAIGDGLRRAAGVPPFLLCKVDLASRNHEDPSARMRRQISQSLSNLGVDRLDAVALHWPLLLDRPVDINSNEAASVRKDAWHELEKLADEGVVGILGVSNFTVDMIDEVLSYARLPPRINEIEFSPACLQKRLVEDCAARNIAAVGYSPYGSCWMAKHFPKAVPWGRSHLPEDTTVQEVAKEAGCTPAQALLLWSIRHGVAPIPKSLRSFRVAESAKVLPREGRPFDLTDGHMARLDALCDPRRGTASSLEAFAQIIASPDYKWEPT